MTLQTFSYPVCALIVIEIGFYLVIKWTGHERQQMLNRLLAGRKLDDLEEQERSDLYVEAEREFNQTWGRKVQLVVIAFHLPALASWVTITGRSAIPPFYYITATAAFWLALFYLAVKIFG